MSVLHIQLLGDFNLIFDGKTITGIHQARQQSLLAYLLLHPDVPQPRQQIAFLFWPDTRESQARTNLRRELYHLRHALPDADQYLEIDTRAVRWRTDSLYSLDVADFEHGLQKADQSAKAGDITRLRAQFERAVSRYRGELLPNCYDDWLLQERERLARRFASALERLILLLEDERDYPGAIRYAERMLRHDPVHEPTYRRLMRLHALNHDRASALRVYHTCTSVLERELGVEPDRETEEAHARLLKMETPAVLRDRSAAPLPASSQLIGRGTEWRLLRTTWRSANRGETHFVLIAGEAGIGKTRLAEELFESVSQRGTVVARTRSYAAEGALAYAPVVEWLRSETVRPTLAKLDDVWLTETARLLPELLVEYPDLPRPEPLTARWQRQRLFEALARAFLVDRQPRLLLIDDLQWCDQETLEWLRYLLRFDPQARLLVMGTVRVEEVDADHPLTALTVELRNTSQLSEIELGPLDGDETATLGAQVLDQELDPAAAAQLYQATEGNPLFVVETVRAGVGDWVPETRAYPQSVDLQSVPPKVQAVIQHRLTQLSPQSHELASLAATIGRTFSFDVLVHASEDDETTLVRGLDELWQRRIIREQGAATYDFSHDRIREAAYVEISPVRRRLLHRRVAEALEMVYAAALDDVSGQIAMHYQQAGLSEVALEYYEQAAEVASRLFADREATSYLKRALDIIRTLSDDADNAEKEISLLLALGRATETFAGFSSAEAGTAYARARELCSKTDLPTLTYRALSGLRRFYGTRGECRKARELSEQLLNLACEHTDGVFMMNAQRGMGSALFMLGELVLARKHFERALAVNESIGKTAKEELEQVYLNPFSRLAQNLWLLGLPDQARQRSKEADRVRASTISPILWTFTDQHRAILFQWLNNAEEVQIRADRIMEITSQYELSFFQALGSLFHGWALVAQDQVEEGTRALEQALSMLESQNNRFMLPYHLSMLADAHAKAGRVHQALTVLDEALTAATQTDDHFWDAELHRQKGELLLSIQTNQVQAEICFRKAITIAHAQQAKSLELRAVMSLSRLWSGLGKQAEAQQMLAEIYGWFTEGFDTPDLRSAKALLAELK